MDVGGAWETFIAFLREYNVRKIAEVSRGIDWSAWLKEPFFWIGVVVFLGVVVWKKAFKMLLLPLSVAALIVLVQCTMPESGEDISLGKLVPFLGGCMVIVALNLYCFIVRHD